MFSQLIIKIVGLIYKLYLTNKDGFGDTGNAIYNSGFQIYALLLTLSSIGVPNAIAKLVSGKLAIGDNNGAYRIFKIAFALFGIIGFAGSVLLFCGAKTIANIYLQIPEAELTIMALSPSVFLVSIASVLRGYFNGRENLSVTANSQSLEQIFKTILTIIIVEQIANISYNNTVFMAAGATIATTLATLFSLGYLYKYFITRKKEVWREVISSTYNKKEKAKEIIKNILKVSIPIAIGSLFAATSKTIDAITVVRILKTYLPETEATIKYGILSGKVDTLITLPYSFNIAFATALVPAVSSAIAKGNKEMAERKINFSMIITMVIGIPSAVLMSVFSEQIIRILFPNAVSGANMLKIASLDIIFVVLIQTINGALQGLGKVSTPVIAFGIGAIVKFLLNILLLSIKSIEIYGAIIATIISHIISFIICYVFLKKNIKNTLNIKKEFKNFKAKYFKKQELTAVREYTKT